MVASIYELALGIRFLTHLHPCPTLVLVGTVGGTMLGRYEVIRQIASGGMADLLLARARGLEGFEHHVVIKRIRADVDDDQAFIDMFLVEARLAGALHHHNIVQVHDVGEENGKPYFAMEYVHGEDLRRLLALVAKKGEQIPFPVAVTIVTAVARALHHAHEQRGADQQPLRIVHRDVSPANVVVGYDGNVKVLDFGIARAAMRRTETQAGMLKGKAPYMAPEQCTGAPIDRRSDVFGLGIVLYELVTARRLFKADNDFATMSMVVNGTFPKPSTIRKDLPPDLERIIMRALARDPGARYQTAEQMFTALEQLALMAEWRTSASSLAAYMTQMFGTRTEPWLEKESIAPPVSVDFDGTRPGLASPPVEDGTSAVPSAITSTPGAPIVRARADAQGTAGVPATSDAGGSAGVRIPEASGPVKNGKVALKPVLATATATRARPKTVQVPVPKSAAVTELVPTTKPASSVALTEVLPTIKPSTSATTVGAPTTKSAVLAKAITEVPPPMKPGLLVDGTTEVLPAENLALLTEAAREALPMTDQASMLDAKTEVLPMTKPVVTTAATKVDSQPLNNKSAAKPEAKVEAKLAPKTEAKPAPKTEAKVEAKPAPKIEPKPLRPLSKLPAKTEPKIPVRAATEELTNPIMESDDTHTEAMPLPPSLSPHAARQLKPLPAPNVAKPIGAKPGETVPSESPAHAPALRPAPLAVAIASTTAEPTKVAEDADDLDGPTEISSASESAFASGRSDPTAIVVPLPSPLLDATPRARRKSIVPLAAMTLVEETDQLTPPPRPRWILPAIGGGVLVLAILVIAIARSGGDLALDEPVESASVTKPPEPTPAPTAAPADEVRTEARPRTWANSQEPDPSSGGSASDPMAPRDPVAAGPTREAPPEPVAAGPTRKAPPEPVAAGPTRKAPPEPVAAGPTRAPTAAGPTPKPVAVESTPDPLVKPVAVDTAEPTTPDRDTTAADPKPAVAVTKPTPKLVTKPAPKPVSKPVPKPVPKPLTKPAPKAIAVAKPKPAKPMVTAKPKPKPSAKPLPQPKWNPNTLFPNKK